MSDPVKVVESKDQIDKIIKDNADKLVIVKFYATWCGPCRLVMSKYKKIPVEFPNKVECTKIDVEEEGCEPLLDEWNVRVTPTFVVLKKGQKVAMLTGNVMNELRETIKKHL